MLTLDPLIVRTKRRKRELCEARQLTSYVLKNQLKMSLQSIADFMGYKNHTSVLHDLKHVSNLMEIDRRFADKAINIITAARMVSIERRREKANISTVDFDYDRIVNSIFGTEWYNNVFYVESLMIVA